MCAYARALVFLEDAKKLRYLCRVNIGHAALQCGHLKDKHTEQWKSKLIEVIQGN